MTFSTRSLALLLLAGGTAFAGPDAAPKPRRVPAPAPAPAPARAQVRVTTTTTGPTFADRVTDRLQEWWWRGYTDPYLPVTAPKPFRLSGSSRLATDPPPLVKVIPAPTPAPAPAVEPAPELPASTEPAPAPALTPEEEAIKFFEPSANPAPRETKNLGPVFDPTFRPSPPPPTSKATYTRE